MKMQNKEICRLSKYLRIYEEKRLCQSVWRMRSRRTWQQSRKRACRQLTLRNGKNLIRRYAKKDENGEIMTEDDCYIMEDKERFGKDMSELLNIETEVEIHTVSISVVEKCDEDPKYDSLTMAELDVIDFMLTE